jgi:hypothetical protein
MLASLAAALISVATRSRLSGDDQQESDGRSG